ncbi:MAG: histidine kinase [Spirochaetales bacterium]|nr:histidine kinase [Spirochaetales bacterium]
MVISKKRTLFTRISQLLIIMICVIFLFSLALFTSIKNSYDVQLYKTFREAIGIAITYLEYELDKISEMTLYLSTDDTLQNTIRSDTPASDDYEKVQFRDMIRDIMFKQAYGDFFISFIELDLLSGEVIKVGRSVGSFESEYNPTLKIHPGYDQGRDFYFVGESGSLVNVRNIRDVSSLDFFTMGTMLTYIDVKLLIQKYQRQSPYHSDLSFIIVKDGKLLIQEELSRKIVQSLPNLEDGFSFYRDGDQSYFITVVTGADKGWTFIGYTSVNDIRDLNKTLWTVMILLHFILAVILILVGRVYVRHFTSPLELLSRDLRAFEENVFSIELRPLPYENVTEEIEALYRDVELALMKIQDQVYKDYVKQMSLQKAQLQMLRSQINPHFLYNTLDSISWMAKSSGEPDLSRMTVALGRLLRRSLNERRERISLKEELILLDDYLAIQKVRFQEKLNWSCEIEPEPESVLMLPFLLQPLVENAIKYGIEEGEGNLSVSLRIVHGDNRMIRIIVCDSGGGFPRVLLDCYKERGMEKLITDDMLGVGLKNIYERIQLYYQGKGNLVISNRPEGGACSMVEFPFPWEKDRL